MEKVVIKFEADAKDLQNMKKELIETGKVSEQTVQKFIEIQKVTTKADEGFKSLKQQIREASVEAQNLSQKFGENSKQATAATQRVANLREEMNDFNDRVKALNPEAKFNALNNVLSATIGAFQGVTGAIQLFGGTSKEAEEIARKMQGALNLTMGINSVLQMGDALKNLRLVLIGTTAAQEALTAAEVEGTVAAKGFTAALSSNALGLILVGLGAIATYFLLIKDNAVAATTSIEELKNVLSQQEEALKNQQKIEADNLALMKERGATEIEITKQQMVNEKLDQERYNRFLKFAERLGRSLEFQRAIEQSKRNEVLLQERLSNLVQQEIIDRIKKGQIQNDATNALKAQFDQEYALQLAEVDKELALRLMSDELIFNNKHELIQADLVAQIDAVDSKLKVAKKFSKDEQELLLQKALLQKKLNNDIKLEGDELHAYRMMQLSEELAAFQSIATSIGIMNRDSSEQRIAQLDDEKKRGIISEEQYAAKLRQIKIRQAKEEKELALFNATLGIAQAIIAAIPKGPLAIALASSTGAFQLAAIAARPIPKFNKGKLPQFGGTYTGDDNQLAWVASEEAIIPALKTRAYYPTLDAIYKGTISPKDFNDFVKGKTKGNKTDLRATINPYDLGRAMNNRKVKIANSSELARSIASELTGQYSARRA